MKRARYTQGEIAKLKKIVLRDGLEHTSRHASKAVAGNLHKMFPVIELRSEVGLPQEWKEIKSADRRSQASPGEGRD
jgi:hypothetical protein